MKINTSTVQPRRPLRPYESGWPKPAPIRPPLAPVARSTDPTVLLTLSELNEAEQKIVGASIAAWQKVNS